MIWRSGSGGGLLLGVLAGALLLLSGCAATTTWTPYPARIDPLIEDLKQNKPFNLQCLAGECRSQDRILYSLERGRLAQIHGNLEFSKSDFRAALEAIVEREERALVSASKIGGQAAAILINDNAIPYMADGYERVMLHHFQALNYLAEKDLEGAAVEVRRANVEQEEALRRHEKEIEQARAKAEGEKIDLEKCDEVMSAYAGLDEIAGKVKNSFQNAYTFYLSGIVYEMLGQRDDAYIDYKKALEIFPGNTYVQRDVIRLAKALKMEEDLRQLRKSYRLPEEEARRRTLDGGKKHGASGEIVVLFEDGFVPPKQEVKVPIPLIRSGQVTGLTAAAFPIYSSQWSEPVPLTVAASEDTVGTTEPICYLDALAVKALKEKVSAMVVRQVLRSTAKAIAAREAKSRFGLAGELGASLYNLASENTDLRSWITLPANAQILRAPLPPGTHRLILEQPQTGAKREVEVEIREGGATILRVVRAGNQLFAMNTTF